MYMLRAYQSPSSAADCGPQCAQMPNLASRNHSGTWYCRSDSRVASKGVAALVRTGAARLPASKPRASLRVSVMCRTKLVFMRRRGIVRRGIVRIHALQRVLKAANALGQTLSELRQLLRAEEQQGDGQDDQQVPGLEQIFNHVKPATIVAQRGELRFARRGWRLCLRQARRPVLPERSKPTLLNIKEIVGDGWPCAPCGLCAPGPGAGGWGCVRGWRRDTNCGSVGVVCPVVKDQGVRLLTGIGGGGGAEGRVVLRSFRHQIIGMRNLWLGWPVNRRLRGLHGWGGLRLPGLGGGERKAGGSSGPSGIR